MLFLWYWFVAMMTAALFLVTYKCVGLFRRYWQLLCAIATLYRAKRSSEIEDGELDFPEPFSPNPPASSMAATRSPFLSSEGGRDENYSYTLDLIPGDLESLESYLRETEWAWPALQKALDVLVPLTDFSDQVEKAGLCNTDQLHIDSLVTLVLYSNTLHGAAAGFYRQLVDGPVSDSGVAQPGRREQFLTKYLQVDNIEIAGDAETTMATVSFVESICGLADCLAIAFIFQWTYPAIAKSFSRIYENKRRIWLVATLYIGEFSEKIRAIVDDLLFVESQSIDSYRKYISELNCQNLKNHLATIHNK